MTDTTPKPLPSQARLQELFRYDSQTGHLFYRERGPGRRLDRPAGTLNSEGYRQLKVDGQFVYAHRAIWIYVMGDEAFPRLSDGSPDPNFVVDHRSSEKDNNRLDATALDDPDKTNLRLATKAQNSRNRDLAALRALRTNSLPRGVTRRKDNRFSSYINDDKRHVFLGYFDRPEDAHAAYCREAVSRHGKFANFT